MEFGPRALGSRSILGDARSRADAVGDEPEDQVPRVVPAVRAVGAARSASTSTSRCGPARTAPTCCWWRRCARRARRARTPADGASGHRQAQGHAAPTIPAITHVDYSARVQTVDAERHGRYYTAARSVSTSKTGCPVHHQHQLQRARRADRLHARGCLPLLHGDEHGRAGARALRAAEGGAARRARDLDAKST